MPATQGTRGRWRWLGPHDPTRRRRQQPSTRDLSAKFYAEKLVQTRFSAGPWVSSWPQALREEARTVSLLTLARLAARCLAYRRENGSFPASLDRFGDDAHDPLSAKPFVLERDGDTWQLSSQAEDAADLELVWEFPE